MKRFFLIIAMGLIAMAPTSILAAEKQDAKTELQDLVGKIHEKLRNDKKTEADLADELKQFDTLLVAHKGEKTDDVAQILMMKAMLYAQVLENPAKAADLIKQLQTDFPETKQGKGAVEILASMDRQVKAKKAQESLAVGLPFPDFQEKDLDGHPLSVSKYKGKVVLVDFWATWCGPCVGELPNVLKAYEKYHPQGLEIVGISLDSDETTLRSFMKKRGMAWQQYFDGKGWENKLAGQYGVMSIPATFLLDKEGKVAAKDLRGEALEAQLEKMLGK